MQYHFPSFIKWSSCLSLCCLAFYLLLFHYIWRFLLKLGDLVPLNWLSGKISKNHLKGLYEGTLQIFVTYQVTNVCRKYWIPPNLFSIYVAYKLNILCFTLIFFFFCLLNLKLYISDTKRGQWCTIGQYQIQFYEDLCSNWMS